jgi:hypothetical protein
MLSALILIVIMIYLTRAFTVQHQTYVVVDQVTEAQQNMRAVANLVERDVRRAGYMVPPHARICGFDDTAGPDTLFVSNTDTLRTVFDLEGMGADLRGNQGAPVSGVNSSWSASGSSFSLTLQRLWVDVQADGDDFVENGGVIVVNRREEDGLVACGIIESISGNTLSVDFGDTAIGPAGFNADVVAVPAHAYRLTPASGGAPSRLTRDGILLASDVEDFQVSYFFDLDDDRLSDTGERFGDGVGTDDAFAEPSTSFPDATLLREVQINVVTVTRDDDPNRDFTLGAGQVTGNRTAGSLPGQDGKRRRVSTARVRVRNAG